MKLTSYKGTRDLYPVDMAERRYIFDGWRVIATRYGYKEYMAPLLEPVEIYAAKSGAEIVNEQTYSFTDRGGRQMVIRPEMTPSITRMVAARRQEMSMPARLYSIANFMRYERPQHGREREFWQLNLDVFGIDNIYAELEIINMSWDVLGYFDPNITVTTIQDGKAVKKEKPQPPRRLVNIVRCRNPRCISTIEEECDQIFELGAGGKYRCIYCEQELQVK